MPNKNSPANRGVISIENNTQYCQNVDQTVISITEDKLENILLKNEKAMKAKLSWTTPLGLFLTCIITLITNSFKEAMGVNPEYWFAFFLLVAIVTFIWTIKAAIEAFKNRNEGDIKCLIQKIKNSNEQI